MAFIKTTHNQATTTEVISVSSQMSSGVSTVMIAAFAAWANVWKSAAEEHAAELQRAIEAASAWRSRFQKSGATVTNTASHNGNAATATAKDAHTDANARDSRSLTQLQACGDAKNIQDDAEHMAELQHALDAAAAWRAKMQDPKIAVVEHLDSDTASTTASGQDCLIDSDVEEDTRSCWVHATFLSNVNQVLSEGLRSGKSSVRLFGGPWGRTGLGRKGEEVVVYIDVARARVLGAEFRFSQNGLVLAKGSVIPASCVRKMVRIANAELFFERQVEQIQGAPTAIPTRRSKQSKQSNQSATPKAAGSPLASWLQTIA